MTDLPPNIDAGSYAWMQVAGKSEAAASCTDPLVSAAGSLMKLDDSPLKAEREAVEASLKAQVAQISNDDAGSLEKMLVVQAQMLHKLFAQSLEKYAQSDSESKSKLFSAIALKAQSYCRMTVDAITRLKRRIVESVRMRNELLRDEELSNIKKMQENYHAALDAGRAKTPGSADHWVATMAQQGT